MSHYLAIITAYAAVAVLVWLAALLHPESIPAAREYALNNRILQLGLFLLAVAATAALQVVENRGWLLPDDDPTTAALNQLVIFFPLVIYLIAQRTPAAALVPLQGLLRSLAGGVALSLVALAAYIAARGTMEFAPELVGRVFAADQIDRFAQIMLLDLGLATVLALVIGGWSRKVAFFVLCAMVILTHVVAGYHAGQGLDAAGAVLLGSAVGIGLLSAIIHTRNAAWFLPVHAMLGVLLFVGD